MKYVTLQSLISRGENSLPLRALKLLRQPLVEELIRYQTSHAGSHEGSLTCKTVELSEDFTLVRVTDASSNEELNVKAWGALLLEAIGHSKRGDKKLEAIAHECLKGNFSTLEEIHLAIERMVSSRIYLLLLAIIAAGLALMWLGQHH